MIETFSMVASTADAPPAVLVRLRFLAAPQRSASRARFSLLLRLASRRGGPDRGPDGVLQPFQRELAVDARAVDVELRGGVDAVPDAFPHVLLDPRGVGAAGHLLAEPLEVQVQV